MVPGVAIWEVVRVRSDSHRLLVRLGAQERSEPVGPTAVDLEGVRLCRTIMSR